MSKILKDPKILAVMAAVIVSGLVGAQFALAAFAPSLSSLSSVPQKNVNYGISRLNTQLTLNGDTRSITLYVNSTQGPVFLNQLQITDTAPGASSCTPSILNDIVVNGICNGLLALRL